MASAFSARLLISNRFSRAGCWFSLSDCRRWLADTPLRANLHPRSKASSRGSVGSSALVRLGSSCPQEWRRSWSKRSHWRARHKLEFICFWPPAQYLERHDATARGGAGECAVLPKEEEARMRISPLSQL